MNTNLSALEVRYFFAKRYWLRQGGDAVMTEAEYAELRRGRQLTPDRMRDLSCFISGYLKAKE